MKIGFDAKRLFTNFTGLGNYSRSLVHHYHAAYPEDELFLFTPDIKKDQRTEPFLQDQSLHIIQPTKKNPFWRTFDMVKDVQQSGVEIYHGLSHELPVGMSKVGVARVVTIHDLIFKYYTEDHPWIDRKIYDWKWKHACNIANKIIAISEQTKQDLINYYKIAPEKITVIYQPADPVFTQEITTEDQGRVRAKHKLPPLFNLYVGSVIRRKNLMSIIDAMLQMQPDERVPLVIVGQGKKYRDEVQSKANSGKIDHLLHWIGSPAFFDFPAIYKSAQMMIYPSLHEGFGLPVMEAMHAGIPVITSNQSSLKEAGGNAAMLINPLDPEELKMAMLNLQTDPLLRSEMVKKGKLHVTKFNAAEAIRQYRSIYESLL